jgi:hypothetical protein
LGVIALVIRPGRPGDGLDLAHVWLDIGVYYAGLDPERFQVPKAEGLAEWFEERLTRPAPEDRFECMAELDGQAVGLVAASIAERLRVLIGSSCVSSPDADSWCTRSGSAPRSGAAVSGGSS